MKDTILNLFKLSKRSIWPLGTRVIKVGEEFGEMCEAVNFHEGYLKHKTMKEPLSGEIADIIITAMDVLREAYKDYSDEELLQMITDQINIKAEKWETILPPA
jgi:hypothetical protein